MGFGCGSVCQPFMYIFLFELWPQLSAGLLDDFGRALVHLLTIAYQ